MAVESVRSTQRLYFSAASSFFPMEKNVAACETVSVVSSPRHLSQGWRMCAKSVSFKKKKTTPTPPKLRKEG